MNADKPTRSQSDNSVSQTESLAPRRDPRTRRIIEHVVNVPGSATTPRDLAVHSGEPLRDLQRHLTRLEDAGYVELIRDDNSCIVLPTVEGEQLVQGGL
jgi:DNA-binding transcriptional ArsR family regulator